MLEPPLESSGKLRRGTDGYRYQQLQNKSTRTQAAHIDTATDYSGESNVLLLTLTAPQIKKMLVRDENTDELYLLLTSTNVLKQKKEVQKMHHVPRDFATGLKVDNLAD